MVAEPQRIPLARPSIGELELEAQARALRSGRLVLGPENAAFEADVAAAAGRPHAVAVASGTAALHLALWALDLPRGGEVIVPAFTFPAPAHVAAALGLTVVPVDVDPATWNLSPAAAEQALTEHTCAMIVVDQFGCPADHAALAELAARRGIPILSDAACAIGAVDPRGRRAGSFGRVACFSFHPRKIVTTGEGGAVVASDRALVERVRRLRNHGQASPGVFAEVGVNLRLPETCAAIGRAQLGRLNELVAERRQLADLYHRCLAEARLDERVRVQAVPEGAGPVWQTFALRLPDDVDRAEVISRLASRGIEAGIATYALHRIGSFAGRPGFTAAALPVADALASRGLALPLWNGMSGADVTRVVKALAEVVSP